jgi:GntR family transcriptional regulator
MPGASWNLQIDKSVPIPLYYQLKQYILGEIQGQRLEEGDSLPTENELCELLGVSRPTVRQALGELVTEGYLTRVKGKGTFVAKPKIEAKFFSKLESFNDEITQKGMTPSTQVVSQKVIEGKAEVNRALGIPESERLFYLERLRFADDEPIVYLETYIPHSKFEGLDEEDFVSQSLYHLLGDRYNTVVYRVNRQIEAVNARSSEAKLLRVDKNSALCLVHTIAYATGDVPVEYSVARYRGDRNKFTVDLYRK